MRPSDLRRSALERPLAFLQPLISIAITGEAYEAIKTTLLGTAGGPTRALTMAWNPCSASRGMRAQIPWKPLTRGICTGLVLGRLSHGHPFERDFDFSPCNCKSSSGSAPTSPPGCCAAN